MIVTQREGSSRWTYPGYHEFVYYPSVMKKTKASTLYIEEMIIPPLSASIGHGYWQHEGSEHSRSQRLQYHGYISPNNVQLKDAVTFVYGTL